MSSTKDNSNNFASVLAIRDSRTKVPALQITRDTGLASMLSKAVDPLIQPQHTADGTRKVEAPSIGTLHNIASRTADNISHADTVMQVLPDTALGAQILISSITSPKDMVTLELSYQTAPGILPPTVLATVMGSVKEHFDNVYRIKDKIPRILQEVLFEKGSHIVAILPENSIDELINRTNAISMESFYEALGSPDAKKKTNPLGALGAPMGFLGAGREDTAFKKRNLGDVAFQIGNESLDDVFTGYKVGTHSFSQTMHLPPVVSAAPGATPAAGSEATYLAMEGITITDNPDVLRIPRLEEKMRRDSIQAKMGFNKSGAALESLTAAMEANGNAIKLDDRSLKSLIYKPRKRGHQQMQVVKTDNQLARRSIGRPLVMELPSESVIPVYTPGQEDRHVGYFVLLDQTGNPIKAMNEKDSFGELQSRLNRASSQTNNIAGRLKQLTSGLQCSETEYTDVMVRVYSDMVEQDLLARLRNGIYSNTVALAKNTDFARVMLSRVLQQQNTTVLFMPEELITYFARKYNQYGVGVSILDEMKILNNMRTIAMMSNTILGIKNSIPRTHVSITVDETNPDPYKTIETVTTEIARVNQTAIPFGATAPVDIADYLARAQYQFNIQGHPALPDTKIEYEERNTAYSKVETDLEDSLQKRALMAMGLTAEHINNGFNTETATSVVANNLMLSRRVMVIQDQINPHITNYHRKILRADEDILEQIRNILDSSYADLDIDEDAIAKEIGNDKANVKQLVINHIVNDFIDGLDVRLPRPNTATIENQKAALENYISLLELALDSYISEKYFTEELGGELSRSVDSVKEMLKAHYIRAYMAENGIMTELSSLVSLTDNSDPEIDLWETQKEHMNKLSKTMSGFLKGIAEVKKEANQTVEDLNKVSGSEGDFGSGSSSEPAESSTGGDDDLFGSNAAGADTETDSPPGGDLDFGATSTGDGVDIPPAPSMADVNPEDNKAT